MDRRKKRTSSNQYMMYIDMMEKDPIFATGRVPRDVDVNYLQKRWKELSDVLNTCTIGPTLTAEEWKKRLNDWKNTTRCKYRRSMMNEDVTLTSLELKALDLFGKVSNVTNTSELSVHLKSEKDEIEDEMDHQRTSESFQKELQAAVEEAIGGDEDEEAMDEPDDREEEVLSDPLPTEQNAAGKVEGNTTTTYRTIVVENANYTDGEGDEHEELEYITQRRQPATSVVVASNAGVQTVVTTTSSKPGITKLINGEIPIKRMRTQQPDQIIYEVKKAPIQQPHPPQQQLQNRNITIHNTGVQHLQAEANRVQQSIPQTSATITAATSLVASSADAREIARQLKRLADIKAEKLKFEVARFKFNNPGFTYNMYPL